MYLRIFFFSLLSLSIHAAPTYFLNDKVGFLEAAGEVSLDGFEDLEVTDPFGQGLQSLDREGFSILPSSDTDGGLFVRTKVGDSTPGFFIDNQRIGYTSLQERGGVTYVFDEPISAFGLYAIDAPEAPDSSGNFDLRYFDSNGRNQLVRRGGIGDETAVFFGVVYENETITSAFFSLPAASDGFAMDSVYISTIPEPASLLILIACIAILTLRRKNLNFRHHV